MRLRTSASGGTKLLFLSLCFLLSTCHRRHQKVEPFIEFTQVPRASEGSPYKVFAFQGRVAGAHSGQQIVLYARSGAWWVQPLVNQPYTQIQPDSSWKNSTHPGTGYAALLVSAEYRPAAITLALPGAGSGVAAVAAVKGEPFFWQTWWFRFVAGLMLLAIGSWG